MQNEERFEKLLETAPIAIYEIDYTVPRFTYVNDAMCKLSGYSREELLSVNPNDLLTTESRERFKERIRKALAGEEVEESVEFQAIVKGNRKISVVLNVKPTFKEGKFVGAFVVGYDVTDRKKTEEALKESEKLYRTLFDNSQDGFQLAELIYDNNKNPIDFRYLKINDAYEKMIGIKASDIVGKAAREIFPDYQPRWLEIQHKVLKTGKTKHVESFIQSINKYFDLYCFPYGEDKIGTLLRDITEHKKLEAQLQEKERLAAIGATAGMVGHDLRNPLQTIASNTYLMKLDLEAISDSEIKQSFKESIESISEQIVYMNKIVSDLQAFVKSIEVHKQRINLNELIASTLIQVNTVEDIETKILMKENLTIVTDPQLLRRVLFNLITNAVQAMPHGGELTIKADVNNEGQTQIIIEDTGTGIPEEIKPKLFQPLFTTKSKGQGFGLAVCKRVLEAQGGTINFESQVGKGTIFTINLSPET
ncbi:MAG TPA: PAS domain S-box protein [Candidatus Sulfotelmatobacter sp.]|nr:PAS domain S-box protein [Candidatus Sulfotelmatobacter sp.]